MTSKPWWQSKTLWFNVGSVLVLFLALPELQAVVGPAALKYFSLVQAGVNILLRFGSQQTLTQ